MYFDGWISKYEFINKLFGGVVLFRVTSKCNLNLNPYIYIYTHTHSLSKKPKREVYTGYKYRHICMYKEVKKLNSNFI